MSLHRTIRHHPTANLRTAAACMLGFLAAAQAGHVCIDAESATHVQSPMRRINASDPDLKASAVEGASGNRYLEIPAIPDPTEEDKKAHALFNITVEQDGDYFLWLRTWWDDECSNSFRISLNEQPPFIMGRNRVFRRWHWVKSPPRTRQLTLTKGTHTLKVLYREDRTKLDQILLTTDRRFVPVDIEPLTSQP